VDSYDHETFVTILFIPGLKIRKCPNAVNTAIGPKIHQDNPTSKPGDRKRVRIKPFMDSFDLRGNTCPFGLPYEVGQQ
jgi:hypothetical protein